MAWLLAPFAAAWGQTVDVERPRMLVVGSPSTGSASAPPPQGPVRSSAPRLPSAALRIQWRASLGIAVEHAPVLDPRGIITVVGERGDVVAISPTGEEIWRLATNLLQPGPSTVLSDGTIVFVDVNGAAAAVRDRSLRWRTRFARGDPARPSPIALDDGGVIVATGNVIAALDSEGHERARLALPDTASSLVATGSDQIAIVTAHGTVWTWTPGALEPARASSFDAAIDAKPALGDAHVLFAIAAGGARLLAADLVRGSTVVRASANGSLWLGPPAVRGDTSFFLALMPGGEVALALDGAGSEIGRAWIGPSPISITDGGSILRNPVLRTSLLVDSEGTLAFAAADGAVGVVARLASSQPAVERISDPCPAAGGRPAADSSVVGMTPLRPGAFLAVCRSGTLFVVQGDGGDGSGK